MARHFHRLILWLLVGTAALALLALLVLAALWWFFDPDDYRAQIESRASSAIGRTVHLTGALHWQLGRRISIVSEGGDIANAAGFGTEPLARWSRIRLGVAARPLLDKRVLIDHVDVDGLQLRLQRNAQGAVNWDLPGTGNSGDSATQSVAVRIADVAVHGGAMHYQDASTGADWHVTALDASAALPADLTVVDREFRELKMQGRLSGKPLAMEGVPFAFQAAALQLSPQRVQVPMFTARWAEASLDGEIAVQLAGPDIAAKLDLQAPSLRKLLTTVRITPPPMRDEATLGALRVKLALRHAPGGITLDDMSIKLDETILSGSVSVPALQPFAVRFKLVADNVNLDRYREPGVNGKPVELPLAWLKQLDAKGSLSIQRARIAGAAAKEVRIDVE